MNYIEAVSYIHSLLKFGIKPGLERIKALLEELHNPQNDFQFIHVAGTNGKGSTSTMCSFILQSAGYRTGLFTSPYVLDFCERIQIDNQNVEKEVLAKAVTKVKTAVDVLAKRGLEPTEFEVITATAFLCFQETHCEWVVLEVGLGGRYDSTNIIPCPRASILTSISLDHTKILGNTVAKIAGEKSGIIKENGLVVTTTKQHPDALEVIQNTVTKQHATLCVGDVDAVKVLKQDLFGTDIEYRGLTVHIPLVGEHQIENAVGVMTAMQALEIPNTAIINGIANMRIHARMEVISKDPMILIDGGHNAECAIALRKVLENYAPKHITVLIGMMADKDCESYVKEILSLAESAVVTVPENPRSIGAEELSQIVRAYTKNVQIEENPKKALELAKHMMQKDGLLLVCGSFYLLSDIFM